MTNCIVAVGACYLDTVLTVPYYPAEDSKLRATALTRRRGGNCPNSLEVLQQLPSCPPLLLCAVLPARDSPATAQIVSSFGLSSKIDVSHCIYRENFTEPASSYIFRSSEGDSRTLVNFNELPEMSAEEIYGLVDTIGEMGAWWHFEGRIPETTLKGIHYLRKRYPTAKVSVEVEKPGREGLQELAAEANVVFYPKSWAQDKGYNTMESFLTSQAEVTPKASLLCCTWGSEGAATMLLPGKELVVRPTKKLASHSVVDNVGAGDTFVAAMLYCTNESTLQWTLEQKLDFANMLAGRKIVQEGFGDLHEYASTLRKTMNKVL